MDDYYLSTYFCTGFIEAGSNVKKTGVTYIHLIGFTLKGTKGHFYVWPSKLIKKLTYIVVDNLCTFFLLYSVAWPGFI